MACNKVFFFYPHEGVCSVCVVPKICGFFLLPVLRMYPRDYDSPEHVTALSGGLCMCNSWMMTARHKGVRHLDTCCYGNGTHTEVSSNTVLLLLAPHFTPCEESSVGIPSPSLRCVYVHTYRWSHPDERVRV